jgi:hypothetical protein
MADLHTALAAFMGAHDQGRLRSQSTTVGTWMRDAGLNNLFRRPDGNLGISANAPSMMGQLRSGAANQRNLQQSLDAVDEIYKVLGTDLERIHDGLRGGSRAMERNFSGALEQMAAQLTGTLVSGATQFGRQWTNQMRQRMVNLAQSYAGQDMSHAGTRASYMNALGVHRGEMLRAQGHMVMDPLRSADRNHAMHLYGSNREGARTLRGLALDEHRQRQRPGAFGVAWGSFNPLARARMQGQAALAQQAEAPLVASLQIRRAELVSSLRADRKRGGALPDDHMTRAVELAQIDGDLRGMQQAARNANRELSGLGDVTRGLQQMFTSLLGVGKQLVSNAGDRVLGASTSPWAPIFRSGANTAMKTYGALGSAAITAGGGLLSAAANAGSGLMKYLPVVGGGVAAALTTGAAARALTGGRAAAAAAAAASATPPVPPAGGGAGGAATGFRGAVGRVLGNVARVGANVVKAVPVIGAIGGIALDTYDGIKASVSGKVQQARDSFTRAGAGAGGAGVGAALGTFVFPGVGTAVGAGVGSAVGWAGATGYQFARDRWGMFGGAKAGGAFAPAVPGAAASGAPDSTNPFIDGINGLIKAQNQAAKEQAAAAQAAEEGSLNTKLNLVFSNLTSGNFAGLGDRISDAMLQGFDDLGAKGGLLGKAAQGALMSGVVTGGIDMYFNALEKGSGIYQGLYGSQGGLSVATLRQNFQGDSTVSRARDMASRSGLGTLGFGNTEIADAYTQVQNLQAGLSGSGMDRMAGMLGRHGRAFGTNSGVIAGIVSQFTGAGMGGNAAIGAYTNALAAAARGPGGQPNIEMAGSIAQMAGSRAGLGGASAVTSTVAALGGFRRMLMEAGGELGAFARQSVQPAMDVFNSLQGLASGGLNDPMKFNMLRRSGASIYEINSGNLSGSTMANLNRDILAQAGLSSRDIGANGQMTGRATDIYQTMLSRLPISGSQAVSMQQLATVTLKGGNVEQALAQMAGARGAPVGHLTGSRDAAAEGLFASNANSELNIAQVFGDNLDTIVTLNRAMDAAGTRMVQLGSHLGLGTLAVETMTGAMKTLEGLVIRGSDALKDIIGPEATPKVTPAATPATPATGGGGGGGGGGTGSPATAPEAKPTAKPAAKPTGPAVIVTAEGRPTGAGAFAGQTAPTVRPVGPKQGPELPGRPLNPPKAGPGEVIYERSPGSLGYMPGQYLVVKVEGTTQPTSPAAERTK